MSVRAAAATGMEWGDDAPGHAPGCRPAGRRQAGPAAGSNMLRYSQADFERVRRMIYDCAGIALNPSKRSMVYSRLSRRLRVLGFTDFAAYLDQLENTPADASEWQEFVNTLTTNLTAFFREAHHFPVLAEYLQQQAGERVLRIWCCAASTGEEPYSLAMTALDALGSEARVSVLASDIDTAVLEVARRGVYPAASVARLDRAVLQRHFERGRGRQEGLVRVRESVRALVRFARVNLVDEQWPLEDGLDVVFCRNVMIYFDRSTQARILRGIARQMKPGGLLFAGHSENFTRLDTGFRLEGKTIYRRIRGGKAGEQLDGTARALPERRHLRTA